MSAFERESAAPMQSDDEDVDEPEFTTYCSFVATKTKPFSQGIYVCQTCNTTADNLCCCAGCATFCHAGHDVGFVAFGEAYCDCGAGQCSLFQRSIQDAVHANLPASSEVIQGAMSLLRRELFSEFAVEHIDYSTAITQATTLVTLSKETFWLPATASPRCYLEELALGIGMAQLRHHLQSHIPSEAAFQQALSLCGFEWWVQVKHATDTDCNSTDDINDGIDLHYDKDETIAEQFGLGIFPALSTVTYLTSAESATSAHPTIILSCRASQPVGAPIREAVISLPARGKHVSFNGELLHGAPQQLLSFALANPTSQANTAPKDNSNTRITFLVNLWIGHQPTAVVPLPDDFAQTLAGGQSPVDGAPVVLCPSPQSSISTTVITSADASSDFLGDWTMIPFVSDKSQWGKDDAEAGLELYVWMPSVPLAALHAAQFNRPPPAVKGVAKKRRTDKSIDATVSDLRSSQEIPPQCTSYRIVFASDDVAAKLEYEEDDEGANEFGDEFCGIVNVKG